MRLTVIGSGSAGNCYVLEARDSALILECGVAPEKMMRMTDFPLSKVAGCLVSHEHGDHAGYVGRYQELGLRVFASRGTFQAIKGNDALQARTSGYLEALQARTIGSWKVKPFDIRHDAAEPLGFIIEHPESGKILFVTDTRFVPYGFRRERLDHIMVEANYADDIVDDNVLENRMTMDRAARVRQTHMSLRSACELIQANDNANLKTVTLIHLSSGNADPERFSREAFKSVMLAKVYVAAPGLTVELNKNEI